MRKWLAALVLAGLFVSGPALAHQCPAMMAEIDAALPSAELSDEELATVTELRAQGEELHDAGDHAGSEEALNEAMEILGLV